tara:strand:+ start:149 stop:946 length:798 start_codon:yes stop_codon:yes gene_type:complete
MVGRWIDCTLPPVAYIGVNMLTLEPFYRATLGKAPPAVPLTGDALIESVATHWWSARYIDTLWTDAGRTDQVDADDDVIWVMDDKKASANLIAVSGSNTGIYKTSQINGHSTIRSDDSASELQNSTQIDNPFYCLVLGRQYISDSVWVVASSTLGSYTGLYRFTTKLKLYGGGGTAEVAPTFDTSPHYLEAYVAGASSHLIYDDTSSGTIDIGSHQNTGWQVFRLFDGGWCGAFEFTDMVILPGSVSAENLAAIKLHLEKLGGIA